MMKIQGGGGGLKGCIGMFQDQTVITFLKRSW